MSSDSSRKESGGTCHHPETDWLSVLFALMRLLTIAYYCSGHGYGHGTRVSAVASYLRQLEEAPTVYIVSSAPKHVFDLAMSFGARYRYAEIDPVIVQPLAYYVDRRKSIDVLRSFLSQKDGKVAEEAVWLMDNTVDCVLSDAAFLACKAANVANIPSMLITNFTFDSVYSYLSIRFPDGSPLKPANRTNDSLDPRIPSLLDGPIPPEEIDCMVKELLDGYRCAELLLRLPGNIPIPSFGIQPALPSFLWTDPERNTFILLSISRPASSEVLHPSIPFPPMRGIRKHKPLPRSVMQAPLVVRHPSPDAYTSAGRKRILNSVGIPESLQIAQMKILIVSFGGQVFRRPHSHTTSRSESPSGGHGGSTGISQTPSTESISSSCGLKNDYRHTHSHAFVHVVPPIATESQLWVPGAPPANMSPTTTDPHRFPSQDVSLDDDDEPFGTPVPNQVSDDPDPEPPSSEHQFLPDDSWIAIVCGAATTSKSTIAEDEELPTNFFLAPKDVYMPDLTALADVLLGKLGYGTTAECVDTCTPFVYVPRPLFVEEHGLKRLLQDAGTGVELSREKYEGGEWADAIQKAWLYGREMKARKRATGDDGTRKRQGMKMAADLMGWIRNWKAAELSQRDAERLTTKSDEQFTDISLRIQT
ncbi:hypothetical protein ACEPAH_8276 [Sanghuangporus vaninii]